MCLVYPIYLTHAIKYRYFSYFLIAFKMTISTRQIFEVFKTGLNHKIRRSFKKSNRKNQVCNEIRGSIDKKSITTAMVATELCKFGKLFAIERK